MNIIVYFLLFIITTFSTCEICLGENLDLILLHTPNGLNMQPHKFCMSCISDWKNKCGGGLECFKCRYKLNLIEQMKVELTVVQRRCTILVEKRQLVLKSDIVSTLTKVSYIRKGNKIMQKFMEKVIGNSTERTRNAFSSWRKLWCTHCNIKQRNVTVRKLMKKFMHNSKEKKRNSFKSWRKFWKLHQDTFCSKCHSQFATYFWQLHAKGYFVVKTENANHEIHQGRLCKDCIKSLPLVEGKQQCPLCQKEIVPVCETDASMFYPLLSLLIYEYLYGGQLATGSNLPSWINRYFTNFAILVSGHCFGKLTWTTGFGVFFVFWLSFNNYIEIATNCSIAGGLVISWTTNILRGQRNLNFQGDLSDLIPKIVYPVLANFISQIYNPKHPKKFSSDPYFPVPISNLLIVVGGHYFLENCICKFHTYEFGYTGRLVEKIIKKHLNLIVFFIELTLLLNVYEFSTFFFVVGCLLFIFN